MTTHAVRYAKNAIPGAELGTRLHSRYSASSAYRWMECPGSVKASDSVTTVGVSGYAADGTQAHELLEYALAEGHKSAQEALIMSEFEWVHNYDTREERIDSVQTALDYVSGLVETFAPDVRVYLECQFKFPTHLDVDAGGTSDVVIYVPELQYLIVVDFKHGAGVAANAVENKQLMFYGAGVIAELMRIGLRVDVLKLVIVQPRAFHHQSGTIREWIIPQERINTFVDEVDVAIIKAEQPDAPLVPGDWCRWCPANITCPALEAKIASAILPEFNKITQIRATGLPDVKSLPVARISELLSLRTFMNYWFNEIEDHAMNLMRNGYAIPDKKLVYVQARRRWEGEEHEIANKLSTYTGLPVRTFLPPKLIGIMEAEKILKDAYKRANPGDVKRAAENTTQTMAYLTTKDTSGKTTIVDLTDKRPAVDASLLFPNVAVTSPSNIEEVDK